MFHCLLSDVFLSKSYQIVIDRSIDTSGHKKDVVDDFNAVQKLYLENCLRMRSRPEKDKINSERMRVDSMNENNGEVITSEECKRLLDLCDKIGTKGDKKHKKHETKSLLKYKYYWVHK